MAKPSIILFGTWGEDNTGDDILLLSQIEGIKARCPECRIYCFSGDAEHTRRLLTRELDSPAEIRIVYTGRRGLRDPGLSGAQAWQWIYKNVSCIARSRLLLIGPGNQIQDVTRRMRVVFFLSRAFLAWMLRTPFAFAGIGFYELRSRFCRWLFRFTCRRADFISTRDQGGADKILEMGIERKRIFALADFSFTQNPPLPEPGQEKAQTPLVGLTTRIFLPEIFPPSIARNFEICLADLVSFIRSSMPVRFRFFPFYKGSRWTDSLAFERLKARIKEEDLSAEVYDFSTLADLRRAVSQCDALIGVRYHSVLLAVQGGAPPMGISYAHKTIRFMQENGLGEYGIRVEDVSRENLRDIWERLWRNREKVRQQLPAIYERERMLAARHFDLIFRNLRRD